MKDLALRWMVALVALLALGPVAGSFVAGLRAVDGGPHATLLVNTSPITGLIGGLGALAIATLGGVLAGRVVNLQWGFFACGLILAWPAFVTGEVREVLRSTQDGSVLWTVAFEGVLFGALGVGAAVLIARTGRRPAPGAGREEEAPLTTPSSLVGLGVAILAGGLVAFLIAREGLKGQTLGAAGLAAIGAAVAGRLAAHRVTGVAFVAALAVLSFAGPAIAAGVIGGDPVEQSYANRLFPLAWISPLDWLSGAFMGAPIGIAWSGTMIEKHAPSAQKR
jgi:hypothetical protein